MGQKKKRVLIIAYLFPPIGGGGVQRALKMAKYLGEFGWEPHILTVDSKNHVTLDKSLLTQLPEDVKIHRAQELSIRRTQAVENSTPNQSKAPSKKSGVKGKIFTIAKKLKNYILIPDDQVLWFPNALKKGTEIIEQYNMDVILSTSGPYTNHLVGYFLKKRMNKPWIADFRDPWTQNMHRSGIWFREKLEDVMEQKVVSESDVLLTVTNSFARNFKEKYADQINRLEVIHNGFDKSEYKEIEPVDNKGKFTFVYAGIFYNERNPRLLLQAIKELINEGKLKQEDLLLKFAGVFDYPGYSENMDEVKKQGLENIVQILGHLPHKSALSEMKGANVLLLINDDSADAGDYIPGKLYEYMAIGNPILALSLEGESANIIKNYGLGEVVHPKSKDEIKNGVLKLYSKWLEGNTALMKSAESEKPSTEIYERRNQAGILAALMDDII